MTCCLNTKTSKQLNWCKNKSVVVIRMDEDEFRQAVIGHIANITRALQEISKHLEHIGSRLEEIRGELIHPPVVEE